MTVQSGQGGLLVCINMNNNKKKQIIPTLCETVDKIETGRKYVRSREVHSPGGMLLKADRWWKTATKEDQVGHRPSLANKVIT